MIRLLFLICLLLSEVSHALPYTIRVDSGLIKGMSAGKGVIAFLGVPYAEAPVGNLRWMAPRNVDSWNGIRSGEHFAPKCMQRFSQASEISEDCLYLNIWTPSENTSDKKPVMVWIHGGGFYGGSGHDLYNQGEILAAKGAVIVTFNYRLGIFGFFGHEMLSAESSNKVSGNYGILDQIAALQWVQRNIGQFGGDPTNVTLLGHSAGAASVSLLMASPNAQGLFQKAVVHSGYDSRGLRRLKSSHDNVASLEEIGETIGNSLGCNAENILPCLRQFSAIDLLNAPNVPYLNPVIDNYLLQDDPGRIFDRGEQTKVPTIIGVVKNEAIRDPSIMNIDTVKKYQTFLRKCFPSDYQEVFQLYHVGSHSEIFGTLEQLLTHIYATQKAVRMAKNMLKVGVQTYLFQFTRVPLYAEENNWGSYHGLDVNYLFQKDTGFLKFTAKDFALSNDLQRRWISFAKSSNPNVFLTQTMWEPYTFISESYMDFGDQTLLMHQLERDRMALLNRVQWGVCSLNF